jgi:thioredoxin-dependent peroxiredoxin
MTRRTLALSLAGLGALSAQNPSDLERVVPGKPAPDFRLPDGDGKPHSLADRRGEPVVVVFYRGFW